MTCKRNQKYLEKFATREVNARIIERPVQVAYGYLIDWYTESLGKSKFAKEAEIVDISNTYTVERWTIDVYGLLDATRSAYNKGLITLSIVDRTLTALEVVQLPSLYASWNRVKVKSKSHNFFKKEEFLKLLDDVFANSLLALREDVKPMRVRKNWQYKIQDELAKLAITNTKLMDEVESNLRRTRNKGKIASEYIRTLFKIGMMASFAVKEGYLSYKEAIRVMDELNNLSELVAKRTRSKNK